MFATIWRSHFACARVQTTVRSTGGSRNTPAWFATISRALTMLSTRSYLLIDCQFILIEKFRFGSLTPSIIELFYYLRLPGHTWSVSFDMWSCKRCHPMHKLVHLVARCCSRLGIAHGSLNRLSMVPCAPTRRQPFQPGMLAPPTCIDSNTFGRLFRRLNLSPMDTLGGKLIC